MKTHFVEFKSFDINHQIPFTHFVNLNSIVSITAHPSKDNHSIVCCESDVTFYVIGTPLEIMNDLYDRVPRDSMTLTYLLKESK